MLCFAHGLPCTDSVCIRSKDLHGFARDVRMLSYDEENERQSLESEASQPCFNVCVRAGIERQAN